MRHYSFFALIILLKTFASADDVADKGMAFLENHCAACHGDDNAYPGLDMRDRTTLLAPTEKNEAPFIVPEKPEESRIWRVVHSHEPSQMPPEDQDQPSKQELDDLKKWIEAGAPFPKAERPQRNFIGENTIVDLVLKDLRELPQNDRAFVRYFSLLHLWNDPAAPDTQLNLTRAAVSKLMNSLSSQPRIAVPHAVDPDKLILRIDLRHYGWNHETHWLALLKSYPYGLRIRGEAANRIYEMTFCDIPYLRADWFVHSAPRPKLYHQLLTFTDRVGLPENVGTLERILGVDLRRNIETDRVWRAGFSGKKSGVSDHNRIVERHDARYGYYWPSYDSAGDSNRQNFSRFPLGPAFSDGGNLGAFDHDGGEFLFSLPNGLQGYMLAKANGERLDVGPQEIVRDPNQFGGNYNITNAISCMGCHKHGMIQFNDTIRAQYENRVGDIADKVRRIYPTKTTMDELLQDDRDRFMRALQKACGSFLKQGDDTEKDIAQFAEPITTISRRYEHELFLTDVARELNLPREKSTAQSSGIKATEAELETVIKFSDRFQRFELLPLTVGEPITRQQWEQVFHPVARELGVGIPRIVN